MSGTPVLIAALSGRALAQSARRAGYVPLVVDAFGDMDTREAAAAVEVLRGAVVRSFDEGSLCAALDMLAAGAPEPPLGVILGSGFEAAPDTAAAVAQRYRVLGSGAEAIRRVKDPERFIPLLRDLGIQVPETRKRPDGAHIWLRKGVGGTGGLQVHWAEESDGAAPGIYFQHYIEGTAVSALVLASAARWHLLGLSQQWANPTPKLHFLYGGAVGPIHAPGLAEQAHEAISGLASRLDLRGLISLDFIVSHHDDRLWLLEINPRPGATLDVFDDESGWLFEAHVAACCKTLASSPPSFPRRREPRSCPDEGAGAADLRRVRPAAERRRNDHLRIGDLGSRLRGNDGGYGAPPAETARQHTRHVVRAAATLYANRGALRVPSLDWPSWSADRSPPGTRIEQHDPLATVIAEGETAHAAEALCRKRLSVLEDMLYEPAKRVGAQK